MFPDRPILSFIEKVERKEKKNNETGKIRSE
jgi:hypothetical protein